MVIVIAVMITIITVLFVITTALMIKDYEQNDKEEGKDGTDDK